MFLLVENYQIDYSSWSSDRLGIFEKILALTDPACWDVRRLWSPLVVDDWSWYRFFFSLLLADLVVGL